MTLNVETPRVVYTGSGTRGPFALSVGGTPITYSAASHIIAERYTDAGVLIETLVNGVDYDLSATSVATGDSAATLTIKPAKDVLDTDERLLIYRETPLSQTLSLTQGGGFSSSANEANYDKTFRILQELYLQFGRQVTINPISSSVAVNLPVPQAGYLLGWNEAGDGFTNLSGIDANVVPVSEPWAAVIEKATIALGLTEAGFSAFIQTLLNDSDAAAARTTLDAQKLDADLTAIAALGYTSGDYLIKKTAANTYSLIALTSAGANLLDDADVAAQRTTLGLGTMATQAASAVAITGGTATGMTSVSATTITATSDATRKQNITPIENALSLVMRLDGKNFDWRETGRVDSGLIAQDLERVMPWLVHTDMTGLKSVNYNGVIAVLVNAVKELASVRE